MRLRNLALAGLAVLLLAGGCVKRVMVPPVIDLKAHEGIGLIEVKPNTDGKLDRYVTHKFLQAITEDQRDAQIFELGTAAKVLADVQKTELDMEAVKAACEKYGVKSIVTGELFVSDVRPKIDVGFGLSSLRVKADVEANLTAKLFDAGGATIWTGSSQAKETVGEVGIFGGGHFSFDAKDPESAYGPLIRSLVHRATRDYRVTWQ